MQNLDPSSSSPSQMRWAALNVLVKASMTALTSPCPLLPLLLLPPQMRWAALNVLVKAYKASVPVAFLAPVLGFAPPASGPASTATAGDGPLPGCRSALYEGKATAAASEQEAEQACAEWLKSYGAALEEGPGEWEGVRWGGGVRGKGPRARGGAGVCDCVEWLRSYRATLEGGSGEGGRGGAGGEEMGREGTGGGVGVGQPGGTQNASSSPFLRIK